MTDWHHFSWYARPGVVEAESNSTGCRAGYDGCPVAKNKEEIQFKLMTGDTTNLSSESTINSSRLFRNTSLGKLSPITGGFVTEAGTTYLYTGVQAEYELGILKITPSFAPGYYNYGDGKDLGYPLEFKTEVQLSYDFSDATHFGMSYNHISNASLGDKNPGANSYMFNFLKKF